MWAFCKNDTNVKITDVLPSPEQTRASQEYNRENMFAEEYMQLAVGSESQQWNCKMEIKL